MYYQLQYLESKESVIPIMCQYITIPYPHTSITKRHLICYIIECYPILLKFNIQYLLKYVYLKYLLNLNELRAISLNKCFIFSLLDLY